MTAVTIDPRESIAQVASPLGSDGIEFIESTTAGRFWSRRGAEGSQCAPNAALTPMVCP
jgi:hypothetical protein